MTYRAGLVGQQRGIREGAPGFYVQQTTLNHVQNFEKTTPLGRDWAESDMYETGLLFPPKLAALSSKENTAHRWDRDATQHHEGVSRCSPASQIMLGKYYEPCVAV